MEKNNTSELFRQKALESLSSPTQLNDVIRVPELKIWIILAAIIIFLISLITWSAVGELKIIAKGTAVVENGQANITITNTNRKDVMPGMPVQITSNEYVLSDAETDNRGIVTAYAKVTLPDGSYDAEVILESVHPIQYIFN